MSTSSNVITVNGLRKTYGSTVAVDDVSFEVRPGEIFGVLGPNGAGKTTTVECLLGLRRPDRGDIRVLGMDPHGDRTAFTTAVGAQLQSSALPEKITVGEAVELYRTFYPDPVDGGELLDRLGLAPKRNTRYAKLSGGQQQRLAIALALVGRPKVAVLDELTTGLDPQARRDTWELIADIRDTGSSVLLVTHFMEEAEFLCDRLAVIDRGRVIAHGGTSEVVAEATGSSQRIRFYTEGRLDPVALAAITARPEITDVSQSGDAVTITGNSEALAVVATVFGGHRVPMRAMQAHQASLDDAFLRLIGRDEETGPGPSDMRPAHDTRKTGTRETDTRKTDTRKALR